MGLKRANTTEAVKIRYRRFADILGRSSNERSWLQPKFHWLALNVRCWINSGSENVCYWPSTHRRDWQYGPILGSAEVTFSTPRV